MSIPFGTLTWLKLLLAIVLVAVSSAGQAAALPQSTPDLRDLLAAPAAQEDEGYDAAQPEDYPQPTVSAFEAMKAATAAFPGKRYSVSEAMPFIIDGSPVYVMAVMDKKGKLRAYAVVDSRNVAKVGVGPTMGDALKKFSGK